MLFRGVSVVLDWHDAWSPSFLPHIFSTCQPMVMPIRDGIIHVSVELDTFRLSTHTCIQII